MLGLVLLYFIGKKFYELADEYEKNKWGFAILGIIVYYLGAFVFVAVLGVFVVIMESDFLETTNNFIVGIMALPFGILSCYGLYYYLEKTWKKQNPLRDKMIDQIGNN